jgi:hypothetical protein
LDPGGWRGGIICDGRFGESKNFCHLLFANLHLLPRKNREVGGEVRWIWTAQKEERSEEEVGWVLLEEEGR